MRFNRVLFNIKDKVFLTFKHTHLKTTNFVIFHYIFHSNSGVIFDE